MLTEQPGSEGCRRWKRQKIINVMDGIFSTEQEPEQLYPVSPWGSACTYATPQAGMIHFWLRFLHHWIQSSHEKCRVKTAQESLKCISERMQARETFVALPGDLSTVAETATDQMYKDLN